MAYKCSPNNPNSKLYRRSLKLALDWAVHRHLWRGQAMYIRGLFDANKHVTEPRQQRVGRTRSEETHGEEGWGTPQAEDKVDGS